MTELPFRQKGLCCELELPADRSWAAYNVRLRRSGLIDGLVAGGPTACTCE